MSGICGIFCAGGIEDGDVRAINEMAAVITHRGPDGSGIHIDSWAALGHRSLHISESESGEEPARNEDGAVWATLDGTIYNIRELCADLEKRGHSFRSASSAEAVAHAYEEYGDVFVRKLRGMFALAVWDSAKHILVLARDRAGEKPLYYTYAGGRFIFASEIKSILLHPAVERRLNPVSMHHLFTFMHVPGEMTMFQNIKKLPPAHEMLVVDRPEAPQQYWNPRNIATEKKSVARNESAALLDMLKESVRTRMSGDILMGAFLTGGIESSAVAGLLGSIANEQTRTFSLAYEGSEASNTDFVKLVAGHFGTKHTEFTVSGAELIKSIPTLLWHYDEPVADSTAVPMYALCKLAAGQVKVALGGEGGDVLFGGPERYVADRYLHYYSMLPEGMRKNVLTPLFAMATNSTAPGPVNKRLEQMTMISPMSDAERHLSWLSFFTQHEKLSLYTPELARELRHVVSADMLQAVYNRIEKQRGWSSMSRNRGFTEQQIIVDFLTYLPETRLMRIDRAGSAAGLEVRSPFMAKEIVELAISLPAELKIKGTTTKRVLKQAMWNFLPTEVLYRQEQQLAAPLDDWFRGPLRAPARDMLTGDTARSRGIFSPTQIDRLLREHESGYRNNGRKIWILLNIELWHRTFMDGPAPREPRAFL